MINSLSQDSHITPSKCRFKAYPSGRINKGQNYSTLANSQGRIARKPAEQVSFCGFSSSIEANSHNFKKMIDSGRDFLGRSKPFKELKEFLNSAIETVVDKRTDLADETKNFLTSHRNTVQSVVEETRKILEDENKKDPLSAEEMAKSIKKVLDRSIEIYPTVEKPGRLFADKKGRLAGFFQMAENNQAVFGALFALVLTGLFRPITIMALPSDKKNKDDKKYAAAHSVASGVIAYSLSLLISQPISNAMKKIENNPDKFLKSEKLAYLKKTRALKAAQKYVNILHEAVLAPPRAIMTIALIPPILKYVFGWEKQKEKRAEIKNQALHGYGAKTANARTKTTFKMFMEEKK